MLRGQGQEAAPWEEMGCGCEALGKALTFSCLSFFMLYDRGLDVLREVPSLIFSKVPQSVRSWTKQRVLGWGPHIQKL